MAANNTSMKKVFATRLTDYNSTDKEGIGCIRFEGAKIYKYIKYNDGTGNVAAVAGNVAYYHGDDSYTGTEAEVTSDLSDSANIGAGILQAAIPDGYYGWIQIKGVATITPALTAGADGNALTPVGATDGTLDVSALVTDHICAIALDASAKIILCDFPW